MSTDDRLIIRSPLRPGHYAQDLSLQIYGPDIRVGIIPYLENFGGLYHGRLAEQTWQAKFAQEKKHMITDMWGPCDDPNVLENIDFKLAHIDLAQKIQHWSFPILLDARNDILEWGNGHSRLIASSVCWSRAWEKVNFLVFMPHDQNLSRIQTSFQCINRIQDDTMLRTVLGVPTTQDEHWVINAGFEPEGNLVRFKLRSIQTHTNACSATKSLKQFVRWQNWVSHRTQADLVIDVNANSPTVIKDSSGRWKVRYVGHPPNQLVSWAQMSARILNEKQNRKDPGTWSLYHFDDTPVDLAELFFAVDLEHSVLHTHDWRTILVQPGTHFKCKELSLSRV